MESDWKIYEGFSRYHIHNWGGVYDTRNDKWVTQSPNSDGYPCVTLQGDCGKRKTMRVHQLVAAFFVPNPEGKPEVNHKFGVKGDNRYEHLEWATHAENIQHAWDTGLLRSTPERSRKLSAAHAGKRVGSDNPKSRSVELVNTGEVFGSGRIAAKAYGIDQGRISRCCNKKYGYKSAGKHPQSGEPLIWRFAEERSS